MVLSAETGERLSRLKETNTVKNNFSSLLKSLIIVGPNGSGKSNLIQALNLMKTMVLNDPESVTNRLRYQPFALNQFSENYPTQFETTFSYSEYTYRYSFEYNADEITSENLAILTKPSSKINETIYFSRDHQNFLVIPDNLKSLVTKTRPNSLFLFNAQQANDEHAINVTKWFQNDLMFVDNLQMTDQFANLIRNDKIKNEFLRFLHFADFNIINVKAREIPLPDFPEQFKKALAMLDQTVNLPTSAKELFTVHHQYNDSGDVVADQEIPLSMESKGTQKIFLIALSIISAQLDGDRKTLLFDEFDDSLHFELSKALLQIFNSKQNKNQFILTTHELQLLDTDLRTDQIYLMEKDFQGRSDLKSVFDFKDSRKNARADVKFMKKYIEGRFGAFPQVQVGEMLNALDASQNDN